MIVIITLSLRALGGDYYGGAVVRSGVFHFLWGRQLLNQKGYWVFLLIPINNVLSLDLI